MTQPQNILYAPATLEDLPAVVDLCMLVEEQHERYWPLRWQRRPGLAQGYLGWMTRRVADPQMLIQVAKDPLYKAGDAIAGPPPANNTAAIVGMIIVSIQKEIPIYTYDQYAYIQDMAVRQSHQRRGIAQQLLKDAAAWSQSQGLNQLRLMVADQNPIAQATFKKAGFLPAYHEMVLPLVSDPGPGNPS